MLDYSDQNLDKEDVLENYKSLSENYDSLESKYDNLISDLEDLFKNSSIYEYKEYKNYPVEKRVEDFINNVQEMIKEIKSKDSVDDILYCVQDKFS